MITRERIIDTREGGAVAVTCPSEWAILALMQGGAWSDRPWWFWIVQFNRMLVRGVKPRAAYRYARMMMTGGATRREAIEIIAARDCEHLGSAIEIVDIVGAAEPTVGHQWQAIDGYAALDQRVADDHDGRTLVVRAIA